MAGKTDGLTIDDLAQNPEVQYVAGKSVRETVRELALTTYFDEKDARLYLTELFPLYLKLQGEGINIDKLLQEENPALKRFWDKILARKPKQSVKISDLERYFLNHDPSLPILLVKEHYEKVEQKAQPGGPRPNEITGLYCALVRKRLFDIRTVEELMEKGMTQWRY